MPSLQLLPDIAPSQLFQYVMFATSHLHSTAASGYALVAPYSGSCALFPMFGSDNVAVTQSCMLCSSSCSHQGRSLKTTPSSSHKRASSAASHTAKGASPIPPSPNPGCFHEPCHPRQAAAGSQQATGSVHQGGAQPPGGYCCHVWQAQRQQACSQEKQSCSPARGSCRYVHKATALTANLQGCWSYLPPQMTWDRE